MTRPADLVQGTLDLLILRVLALEPMHGWAIAQRIRQMSSEQLRVGQSALYPALHKLEQQGWIEAEWAQSENNGDRRAAVGGAWRGLPARAAGLETGSDGGAATGRLLKREIGSVRLHSRTDCRCACPSTLLRAPRPFDCAQGRPERGRGANADTIGISELTTQNSQLKTHTNLRSF